MKYCRLLTYRFIKNICAALISQHFDETGSARAQEILADFDAYAPLFKLVKPTVTDVKTLLGHRSRSSAELRVQAQ